MRPRCPRSSVTAGPPATLQIRITPSRPPVAKPRRVRAERHGAQLPPEPVEVADLLPVPPSQSRTRRSEPTPAMRVPSGLNDHHRLRVALVDRLPRAAAATVQSRTVPSSLELTTRPPSASRLTPSTASSWPSSRTGGAAPVTSNTRTEPSPSAGGELRSVATERDTVDRVVLGRGKQLARRAEGPVGRRRACRPRSRARSGRRRARSARPATHRDRRGASPPRARRRCPTGAPCRRLRRTAPACRRGCRRRRWRRRRRPGPRPAGGSASDGLAQRDRRPGRSRPCRAPTSPAAAPARGRSRAGCPTPARARARPRAAAGARVAALVDREDRDRGDRHERRARAC